MGLIVTQIYKIQSEIWVAEKHQNFSAILDNFAT